MALLHSTRDFCRTIAKYREVEEEEEEEEEESGNWMVYTMWWEESDGENKDGGKGSSEGEVKVEVKLVKKVSGSNLHCVAPLTCGWCEHSVTLFAWGWCKQSASAFPRSCP